MRRQRGLATSLAFDLVNSMKIQIQVLVLALILLASSGRAQPSATFSTDGPAAAFTIQAAQHNFFSACAWLTRQWFVEDERTGQVLAQSPRCEVAAPVEGRTPLEWGFCEEGQNLWSQVVWICDADSAVNLENRRCLDEHEGIPILKPAVCGPIYRSWALRSLGPTTRNGRQFQTALSELLRRSQATPPAGEDLCDLEGAC